ncbi:MAG: undecaprenyl-diphosphate phosphatase [Lachnospiraceae bacterium]|nr:undecaprenyl-diphosphate phosphatase [Lachnospiraceae bacterium]
MLEILKVIILGIIEGITEWLPISSTGHLILAEEILKPDMTEGFFEMFEVVIQFGAILAVIVLYFNKLNPFPWPQKKDKAEQKQTWSLWFKVIVACLPAAIIGLLFDDLIDSVFYNYQTVAITLVLYGVLFIIVEKYNKNRTPKVTDLANLSYKTVLLIGIIQLLALIPGTSRSGATILGAILIGCKREVAAEFTFFLAIPVMFGASLLKIVKYGLEFGLNFSGNEIMYICVGMIVAFVVSIVAIKFLMGYIKKKDFTIFGYYRIVLGILVLGYFIFVN